MRRSIPLKPLAYFHIGIIIILSLAVYGNSLYGKFLWDDKILIEDNAYVKDFNNIPKIFSENIGGGAAREKKEGARIVTIGAPARGNSLLNFVKIDQDLIDYACEKGGSPKIGLFTPGSHIPIVDEKKLFDEQPEYALMLSWHIGDELMKKLRELGYHGKFILPLPEPHIVENI